MKKLSIIGTAGIPGKYGGFETLAEQLALRLKDRYEITVYCSSKMYSADEKSKKIPGIQREFLNLNANGWQSMIYDGLSAIKACKKSDFILLLGVSGGFVLPFLRFFTNKTLIANIDGLEWRRDKWNFITRKLLRLLEKMCVKHSHHVIADNEIIKKYVRFKYNIEAHCIAYGGDHVQKVEIPKVIPKQFSFLKEDYAFKVARIEPENNIDMILEAFDRSEKKLVIVGNWENSQYGIDLKNKYLFKKNLILLDPIYESEILNLLRSNCKIYIHGHGAGGTNPSLVEIMYLGVPVFAFNCGFNVMSTCNKAKYFKNALDLRCLIDELKSDELDRIGNSLKEIAVERYTWSKVSNQYIQTFQAKKSKIYYHNNLGLKYSDHEFTKYFINEFNYID